MIRKLSSGEYRLYSRKKNRVIFLTGTDPLLRENVLPFPPTLLHADSNLV